jgi:casein kinase II subunit beta
VTDGLGAYFGTTFPHLFFQTFSELLPSPGPQPRLGMRIYVPKIYGFKVVLLLHYFNRKVSERAKNGPRMQWLRMIPSEEARQTRRGVRRYFELMGEPIEISDSAENSDEDAGLDEEEGEVEERGFNYTGEGFEMEEEDDGFQNHIE